MCAALFAVASTLFTIVTRPHTMSPLRNARPRGPSRHALTAPAPTSAMIAPDAPRCAIGVVQNHHALTAELVSLVDVPVVASGDIISRARAQSVLATTGAAAVMVGRSAQGNPWVLREIVDGDGAEPSREEVAAELIVFVRETVRELGERRASGFLKKFYGWYLGRSRFPKQFKQELVQLQTTDEVVQRLLIAAPGAAELLDRLEAELPSGDEITLELPISIYGGG